MERLERFGKSENVSFPLISDSKANVARLYDVRRRFGLGTSRVTYIVDKEGVIRDVYHNELFTSKHARRALQRVDAVLSGLAE